MPPPDAPTHDQMDRSIAAAIAQVEKLMDARMGEIRAELRGLRRDLEGLDHLQDQVASQETRLTAVEAFVHAQEKRLGESRAYRKIHLPTIAIAGLALLVAVGMLLVAVL